MIEEYLKLMRNKALSLSTITGNTRMLLQYSDWLWNTLEKKVNQATEDDLEKYILSQKESKAPGTV